jgi:1-acyl-sn-glycerol-3-phosphate acyltransferase
MQRARLGVAFIADRAKVPILPIGVVGEVNIFRELRRLRRARVQINIGPTFTLPPLDGSGARRHAQLRETSDLIMRHLADLLPPEYWGVYRPSGYRAEAPSSPAPVAEVE